MGPEGFEPTAPRLWAWCSNQAELRAPSNIKRCHHIKKASTRQPYKPPTRTINGGKNHGWHHPAHHLHSRTRHRIRRPQAQQGYSCCPRTRPRSCQHWLARQDHRHRNLHTISRLSPRRPLRPYPLLPPAACRRTRTQLPPCQHSLRWRFHVGHLDRI